MKQKWPQYPLIVPKAGSFLFRGGKIGCLLVHGYTASAEEMLSLGEFLAKQGYTVLGIRLAGHGTHPTDLSRVRYQDWLNSIQDGYFMLKGMTDKVFLIGQSLGAMLSLISTPEISPAATIAISTPYNKSSFVMQIVNQIISILFPLMPKWHLRKTKILDERREANYPAYPIVATRSVIELEKAREMMVKKLGEIHTPVLLIQSHKDLSESSVAQITSRLTNSKYKSIWHEDLDHSMVLDQQRQLVFDEINQYIRKIAKK
jgi:carboxylesterase